MGDGEKTGIGDRNRSGVNGYQQAQQSSRISWWTRKNKSHPHPGPSWWARTGKKVRSKDWKVILLWPFVSNHLYNMSKCQICYYATSVYCVSGFKLKIWSHLHLCEVGKVSRWDLVLLLNLMVDFSQVGDQLLLLGVFSKHAWHFLFQRADNVRLHLDTMKEIGQTHFFDFIELGFCCGVGL